MHWWRSMGSPTIACGVQMTVWGSWMSHLSRGVNPLTRNPISQPIYVRNISPTYPAITSYALENDHSNTRLIAFPIDHKQAGKMATRAERYKQAPQSMQERRAGESVGISYSTSIPWQDADGRRRLSATSPTTSSNNRPSGNHPSPAAQPMAPLKTMRPSTSMPSLTSSTHSISATTSRRYG